MRAAWALRAFFPSKKVLHCLHRVVMPIKYWENTSAEDLAETSK